MKTQEVRNPLLTLQMGSITVVVLSLGAVAALMAVMPSVAAVSPSPTFAHAEPADEPQPRVHAACEQCAVVTAMREIKPLEHEINSSAESTRRYQVTVRMRNGSTRVIEQARPANWRMNERLILIGGAHARNES